MEDENLKSVTENLYKQNLELAVKNKTLSLMGKLYGISILTLKSKDLAEKVNSTIQNELSFELVGILTYNQEKDELSPLSFSESERLHNTELNLKFSLESVTIPSVSLSKLFKTVLQDRVMTHIEDLHEIWGSMFSGEIFEKIKSDGHIKSSILYPLIIENKVIGVLLLSLNRSYDDLVEYEKESITSFINVIAVALDKSMLYEELIDTNEKLKEANQGQASLMHFMNHQIKGRFGNARNIFAELLTNDYGDIPQSAKPLLEKGLDETKMGVDYVQSILKGASAENGTLPYDMKPMDFKSVVESVIPDQKANAEKKGLSFNLEIVDANYSMTGDAVQLSESVKNLIDNSINYTKTGSINVKLFGTDKIIRLEVKDTGVGLSDEDKPKLFKSGGRGSDSLKVNTNSTGYGLAFVKGVVDAHKGRVWAESEGCDKGSTFIIELPR